MANIYILAGAPGIGKSTAGTYFVPDNLDILDPDRIAERYKTKGFSDYKDIGNLRFNELVRQKLFTEKDFGIELNLGFQSHYDFVKSIKKFNFENTIEVVLFHSDSIDLCYQRAKIRHDNGLHFVSPEIILQMYEGTLPLLKENFIMISNLTLVNVTDHERPKICLKYHGAYNKLEILSANLPLWVEKELKEFLVAGLRKKQELQPKLTQDQNRKRRGRGI